MSSSSNSLPIFGFDRLTLGLYAALVSIGWLMIFAVNYNENDPYAFLSLSHTAGKQLAFMAVCGILMFVVLLSDWSIWRTLALPMYAISMLLLPGTLLFGREVNGANAWYHIGGFTFQPSEIAKFGACLAMAAFLSSPGVDLRQWRDRIIAFSIFLIPSALVLLQSDTGSALVFFSFMLVLYREGLSPVLYALGFGTAALVILGWKFEPPAYTACWLIAAVNFLLIRRFRERRQVWMAILLLLVPLTIWWIPVLNFCLAPAGVQLEEPVKHLLVLAPHLILFLAAFIPNYWKKNSLVQGQLRVWAVLLGLSVGTVFAANALFNLLAPHQQQRIKIWLRPKEAASEARGAAYNLLHSKMAIGSGGLLGKGTLEGNMTKLKYVPEQSTDFIFCTVGEEQGFLGVVGLIGLFLWLLWRITIIAERQRSNFSRIYAYSVAGIIFIHLIVNLGMTMGLLPIIGIPLPFISAGGSSLIGFTLMIAVLLKLDSNRNLA
ncbi:MAG TPA: rod shape-determining protein RodA [Saprospiraceae bacterium]|nr:rod shape-determining protein RodA [Saprospiraceae bacterium]